MKNVREALAAARLHFYESMTSDFDQPGDKKLPIEQYRLNRSLQYDISTAFMRIMRTCNEVTLCDVVMLCETWVISHRAVESFPRPIVAEGTPEDMQTVADKIVSRATPAVIAAQVVKAIRSDGSDIASELAPHLPASEGLIGGQ